MPSAHSLLSRAKLWRASFVGRRPKVLGRVWIHGDGDVRMGDDVVFDGSRAPIELCTHPGSTLIIGNGVRFEGGACVEAMGRIVIGDGCVVRAFVRIMDSHFHPLTGDRHERAGATEVVVGEGCDIGARSILLPGAHLGRGARLGPSTVLSKPLPAGAWASGNPPRILSPQAPLP